MYVGLDLIEELSTGRHVISFSFSFSDVKNVDVFWMKLLSLTRSCVLPFGVFHEDMLVVALDPRLTVVKSKSMRRRLFMVSREAGGGKKFFPEKSALIN